MSKKKNVINLFLISFSTLFFELFLIRWIPSNIPIIAYFTNTVLLSSFLGLGVGVIISGKKQRTFMFFLSLLCIIIFVNINSLFISRPILPFGTEETYIWDLPILNNYGLFPYFLVLIFFGLIVGVFIPIGQYLGESMDKFPPLEGYSINIVGSIFGILVFSTLSLFSVSPRFWFLLGICLILYLFKDNMDFAKTSPYIVLIIIPFLLGPQNSLWSPYYKIDVHPLHIDGILQPGGIGHTITVNNGVHQYALNLSSITGNEFLDSRKEVYDVPYLFKKSPINVLILGAGTGNDVSAAIRNNAKLIDAVEIDPKLVDIGRLIHPEKPYQNSHVNVIIDDARSYVKRTNKKYDVIVLGFLDSHKLFSSMANLRLDNFVYTKESFRDISNHLGDDGILVVTFAVHEKKWIADRLYSLVYETFDNEPIVYQGNKQSRGTVIIGGNSLVIPDNIEFVNIDEFSMTDNNWMYLDGKKGFVNGSGLLHTNIIPEDDWPHLYIQKKTIPKNYLLFLFVLLTLSIGFIVFVMPQVTKGLNYFSIHFLFLGVGFMLIETKSVTELAIIFGSTWFTNSIVFIGILIMIFLANLFVTKYKIMNIYIPYTFLIGSISLNYFFPVSSFLGYGDIFELVISTIYVSIPLFFAAIIFSTTFKNCENIPVAFGFNLMGAVFGGVLEYISLFGGFRSLYIVGILTYMISLIAYKKK